MGTSLACARAFEDRLGVGLDVKDVDRFGVESRLRFGASKPSLQLWQATSDITLPGCDRRDRWGSTLLPLWRP